MLGSIVACCLGVLGREPILPRMITALTNYQAPDTVLIDRHVFYSREWMERTIARWCPEFGAAFGELAGTMPRIDFVAGYETLHANEMSFAATYVAGDGTNARGLCFMKGPEHAARRMAGSIVRFAVGSARLQQLRADLSGMVRTIRAAPPVRYVDGPLDGETTTTVVVMADGALLAVHCENVEMAVRGEAPRDAGTGFLAVGKVVTTIDEASGVRKSIPARR
jgi:hypothetical protein